MPRWILFLLLIQAPVFGQQINPSAPSACHVFIDYHFIWTLEVVQGAGGDPAPILNIITLRDGQWDLRPSNVHLLNEHGEEAEIERFIPDTGAPDAPQLFYLKVRGNSFIGLDLSGDFTQFQRLKEVSIELGDSRFILEPLDCLEFESVAHQINQINYDSPDIRQDYSVLGILVRGRREARRRFY